MPSGGRKSETQGWQAGLWEPVRRKAPCFFQLLWPLAVLVVPPAPTWHSRPGPASRRVLPVGSCVPMPLGGPRGDRVLPFAAVPSSHLDRISQDPVPQPGRISGRQVDTNGGGGTMKPGAQGAASAARGTGIARRRSRCLWLDQWLLLAFSRFRIRWPVRRPALALRSPLLKSTSSVCLSSDVRLFLAGVYK